jgi:hypothetical protein
MQKPWFYCETEGVVQYIHYLHNSPKMFNIVFNVFHVHLLRKYVWDPIYVSHELPQVSPHG